MRELIAGISFERRLMVGAAMVAIAAVSAPAAAQTRNFDVPEQPASRGIPAFAKQAGVQILASGNLVAGKRTKQVRGRYPVEEGLKLLLDGTDLVANFNGSGQIITIQPAPRVMASAAVGDAVGGQADAEIVVIGTNIRGAKVASPTMRIDRDEIQKAGFSSVEQIFDSLPQNFGQVSPAGFQSVESASILSANNYQRATAIDLRGLGAQSTLTLINGTRRAGSIGGRVVDISNIPLPIIERVEIVTGGRSAIYGADAVAGVVNLVTRKSFDGAESQAYAGLAEHGGGERLRVSQLAGVETERAGFVAAYEYMRDWKFDAVDVGLLSNEPGRLSGVRQINLTIQAPTKRHSAYLSGRFAPSSSIELFADLMYNQKSHFQSDDTLQPGSVIPSTNDFSNRVQNLSVAGGADVELSTGWSVRFSGATSSVRNQRGAEQIFQFPDFFFTSDLHEIERSTSSSLSSIVNGKIPIFADLAATMAIGAEWRSEGFSRIRSFAFDLEAPITESLKGERDVLSFFGEASLPLPVKLGFRHPELSLAARYDRYNDVGSTLNPQAGLFWEVLQGVTVRGSYASSFRAPSIIETLPDDFLILQMVADPEREGQPTPVLFRQGVDPEIGPEKAKTWTLGLDYEPAFATGVKLSLSYLNVVYRGRIEQPVINIDRAFALERAGRYPGLISRNPMAAELSSLLDGNSLSNETGIAFDPMAQEVLSVFPGLIVFDNRTKNLAVEKLSALDAAMEADIAIVGGVLNLGINATYTIEHKRSVTANSPFTSLINSVGKPADFLLRGNVGYSNGSLFGATYLNYVDGYRNPFSQSPTRIGSWATIDASVGYDSAAGQKNDGPGISITLSVNNLFDRRPPLFAESLIGLRYDASNANPFGRYISLRVAQKW